jgi:hypothetical protein
MKPGAAKKQQLDESILDDAEGDELLEESVYEEVDHYYGDDFRDTVRRGGLD